MLTHPAKLGYRHCPLPVTTLFLRNLSMLVDSLVTLVRCDGNGWPTPVNLQVSRGLCPFALQTESRRCFHVFSGNPKFSCGPLLQELLSARLLHPCVLGLCFPAARCVFTRFLLLVLAHVSNHTVLCWLAVGGRRPVVTMLSWACSTTSSVCTQTVSSLAS